MTKYSRQIIAIVCVVIIILRLFFPSLNFDIISLTLLAIALLAIIIPQPEKIFKRTKKIKFGSFELELEELNKSTEKLEEKIQEQSSKSTNSEAVLVLGYQISSDLHIEVLRISIDIEKTLREIYKLALKTSENRPLAVSELIENLRETKIIDLEVTKLLRQFWIFRNNIVHSSSYNLTKQEFISFIDIGLRILKILKTLQNNINDGTIVVKVIG